MSTVIRVQRPIQEVADAYDRHDAIVKIDGVKVGMVVLGESQEFTTTPGNHDVSIRLRYNYGTGRIRVEVADEQTVLVVAAKARGARSAIPPSSYWNMSVS